MTAAVAQHRPAPFAVERVRADFPALHQQVHGRPLVYLDNAASSQTPAVVVEALEKAYLQDRSNVHRGVHTLSQRATTAFEAVRGKVREFLGASREEEIIFTRGTTEALNLVAQTWGRANIGAGDRIVLTVLEHHSNIVPWQMLAEEKGAVIDVVGCDESGALDLDQLDAHLARHPKLLAIQHVSNAIGTVHPLQEIVRRAHDAGAVVVVDGAQAVPHFPVDVVALGADFYAASSHKVFGPTGVGVLYGRYDLLATMPPWQGGGDMIEQVSFSGTTFAAPPGKFEAGTPDITAIIAFGAALDWLAEVDLLAAARHEHGLLERASERLIEELPGARIVGTAPGKAAVLSFVIDGAHPHDLGMMLDEEGVAVRTGHHCAQPAMERFGVSATTRASFALYNTEREVDAFIEALKKAAKLLT